MQRPHRGFRKTGSTLGLTIAIGVLLPLLLTAPAKAWGHGGAQHAPQISLSAAPDTVAAPIDCLAQVVVTMTNDTDAAGFVTVDFDVPDPLEVSRPRLVTYFVAHYTWSTSIAVTVPPGTEAGTYPLHISTDTSDLTVPVSVAGGGAHCLAQDSLSATASSWHSNVPPANAVDGDIASRWGVEYRPYKPGPQSITIDTGAVHSITELRYWPRQDLNNNGIITAYNVYVSTDGSTFTKVGSGSWAFDHAMKTAAVDSDARYVRLEVTEGGRNGEPTTGGYGVAAEIQLVSIPS